MKKILIALLCLPMVSEGQDFFSKSDLIIEKSFTDLFGTQITDYSQIKPYEIVVVDVIAPLVCTEVVAFRDNEKRFLATINNSANALSSEKVNFFIYEEHLIVIALNKKDLCWHVLAMGIDGNTITKGCVFEPK